MKSIHIHLSLLSNELRKTLNCRKKYFRTSCVYKKFYQETEIIVIDNIWNGIWVAIKYDEIGYIHELTT